MAFAGGSGTLSDPYLISTATQLNDVRNYLGACFKQTADINLSGTSWTPIGSWDYPFEGSYDGDNHKITGLTISGVSTEMIGLFGCCISVYSTAIQNVNLEGVSITVDRCEEVGALIGWLTKGNIVNCHSSGNIYTYNYVWAIGGLIGEITTEYGDASAELIINDCTSAVNIVMAYTGVNNWVSASVGGLIGYSDSYSGTVNISNSSASGNVFYVPDTQHPIGSQMAGGFIGEVYGAVIEKCFSSGDVHLGWANGGFVGYVETTTFRNCYSRSDIYPPSGYEEYDNYNDCGGFAGNGWDGVTFEHCYAAGRLEGLSWDDEGSLAGFAPYSTNYASVTGCYYDITICPRPDEQAVGKTTAEMKSQGTFTGWDFSTVWGISPANNDGYPCFILVTAVGGRAAAFWKQSDGTMIRIRNIRSKGSGGFGRNQKVAYKGSEGWERVTM